MGVAAFTQVATIPPAGLIIVPNQSLLAIETNLFRGAVDPDNADGGNLIVATVFTGEDSAGTHGLAGIFGTEFDEDESGMGVDETLDILITINPLGVNGTTGSGIDGTTGAAKDLLDKALTLTNDPNGEHFDTMLDVTADPATVVPGSHYSGGINGTNYTYGRWSDGKILFVDEVLDGPNMGEITVEADDLPADQYFHYLLGDVADTNFGAGATGTYTLPATNRGTASTDTHDGFVGNGVQSGSLAFDFTSLNGRIINMVIDHADTYTVNGDLHIDPDQPGTFYEADNRVFADTNGGLCNNNSCTTFIEGSFFGDLEGTGVNGAPGLAGLNYEILSEPFNGASGNSIIGNAIFSRSGTAAPIPDTFTITPDQGLVVVLPNPAPPVPEDFADVGLLTEVTTIVGDDSMNTTGLLAAVGFELNDDNYPDPDEILFLVATNAPSNILDNVSSPDPLVVAAQGLISDALVSDNAVVESVNSNPAKVAEFFQGNGFAYSRWADGKVLVVDENVGGGGTLGAKTVDAYTLANYQSWHAISGDTPATPQAGATGVYEIIASSPGTRSTTASGATIGQGVTDGTLTFYFDN